VTRRLEERPTPARATLPARARVLGCEIDRVDMERAVERCERFIVDKSLGQHLAVNAAKLVAMRNDPALREIASRCELVTADGQAVVWASRLLGDPLPARVAGIDLMWELLALAERQGYRVFILGARPAVLDRALTHFRLRHPALVVAGARDGYFADSEHADVVAEIAAARPDMLFVGMSSPAKEYFLGLYGRSLGVPFIMGVGGALDVAAGVKRRAPVVMQRAGLEWLFRLAQEPQRLLGRYVATNSRFVLMTFQQAARRRPWKER
jgi:N-acetylglucosaminyldiphosphoundecaprenol N-acetyl-beta-D-mannosaminyltransferase